jgi:predicted membrane channel-forming protein YqfA (hemolysin III family)
MRLEPTWRQPAGIVLILVWIAAWSVAAVSASVLIAGLPAPVHILYYLIAGIVWILPLKPLLCWMETGRWRDGGE